MSLSWSPSSPPGGTFPLCNSQFGTGFLGQVRTGSHRSAHTFGPVGTGECGQGPVLCCGRSWERPLPGNEATSKVANLLLSVWHRFCPADRSKAVFRRPYRQSRRGDPIKFHKAISAPPSERLQRDRAIFFHSSPLSVFQSSALAPHNTAIIPKCPVGEIVPPRHLSSDLIN